MGTKQTNRLTAVAINAKKLPGYYPDGNGLYLQVSPGGSKSWIFRYTLCQRSHEMGLGSLTTYSLADARDQARSCRQLLKDGIDPLSHRTAQRQKNLAAIAQRRTFEQCAREYHQLHASGWKNLKHADQWISTLTAYAFPVFGSKDISAVSKADILQVLEPMWLAKPETASRVRQRIRTVLDWSAARDYRTGHDPHLWDQVAKALPKTRDIKKSTHFAACPYTGVYAALQSILQSAANERVKLALAFIVLTASRSGEVRGARWSEIDWQERRWVIPAARMKAGREHRVPLSDAALEVLKTMHGATGTGELVFGNEKGKPYSDMTFTMLLRRLGHTFTVHGFRSTFRDWAAEQTAYPREVCEAALAHSTKDATEAAYFRSDLFEKRRQLMAAWAAYCASERQPAQVLAIIKTAS